MPNRRRDVAATGPETGRYFRAMLGARAAPPPPRRAPVPAGPAAPLVATIVTSEGVQEAARLSSVLDLLAGGRFFWIDLVGGDEQARASFLDELGFDEADIDWMNHFGHAGRLAINQHRLRAATWLANGKGAGLTEVHVLGSRACVVSVWNGDARALHQIRDDFAERLAELERSPSEAAAILLQLLLGTMREAISDIDARLQMLQARLRSKPSSIEFSILEGHLLRLQSDWSKLDRYSGSVRTAIIGVSALPSVDAGGAAELSDYAEQVADLEHRLQQRASWGVDLMQDFAVVLAQRQASQITRLTIVSMVFLPIIFLTGFFSTKWMTAAIDSGSTLLVLGLLLLSVAGVAAMLVWVNRRRSA
jgi:Mg2+ and Co2+ transporter CorA